VVRKKRQIQKLYYEHCHKERSVHWIELHHRIERSVNSEMYEYDDEHIFTIISNRESFS
jgi:hypothetical protein